MAKHKFPRPQDVAHTEQCIHIPTFQAVEIYNDFTRLGAKNLAKGVIAWWKAEAKKAGWEGILVPYHYPNTDPRAGVTLLLDSALQSLKTPKVFVVPGFKTKPKQPTQT